MRCGGLGGRFNLGIAGVGPAKADVFARRVGKDHRVLRHQRDVLAKIERVISRRSTPSILTAPSCGS